MLFIGVGRYKTDELRLNCGVSRDAHGVYISDGGGGGGGGGAGA